MQKTYLKKMAVIIFFAASIFSLVHCLNNYYHEFFLREGIFAEDILYRILGDSRKILADLAYMKADEYLHGGAKRVDKTECQQIGYEDRGSSQEHEEHHEDHKNEHGDHKHAQKNIDSVTGVAKWNILLYIGEFIHICKHLHVSADQGRELFPWYYYAAKLNPEKINAYINGGYWAGIQFHKPEEAIKFLEKGLLHNADSWEIFDQIGQIYHLENKDYKSALLNFEKAYKLLTDDNSSKIDKRRVYSFMADCYQKLGQIEKAVEFYKKILILFPQDKAIPQRITSLLSATY